MVERILIVDDDRLLISMMRRLLGDGFSVCEAYGGDEALEVMTAHGPFAVVLSDMRMPGMSGVELLQRIRQMSPDTVRLICTGDGEAQAAVRAVNDGAVFRLLAKPYTADVLRSTVRASIDWHHHLSAERTLRDDVRRRQDLGLPEERE
jgi:DNA-binding NtrC family response regulator